MRTAALEPATPAELASCPFCAGREERTPPETLRLPERGAWRVRVVPNLFPALERQEVVVHAPEHARSIAELDDDQITLVADAWRRRAKGSRGYVHASLNEGRQAGASLPHSHSQLAWFDSPPPVVAAGLPALAEGCVLCTAPPEALLVGERSGVAAWVRAAGRLPYELLIAPRAHEPDAWTSPLLADALSLAADAARRLRAIEGAMPLNLWLHAAGHWHVELLPRSASLAALELGAGVFVTTLAPEEAAARLRRASPAF